MAQYWLMKSEPEAYSIDDLIEDKTTCWDGVRNYQARNFMRDQMKPEDLVFFYHSNSNPSGIAGIAKVVKAGYPELSAFDPKSKYFDPESKKENPVWYTVDIRFVKKFPELIALDCLRKLPGLEKMPLLQRGQRLSVQPVSEDQWNIIMKLAEV